MLRCNIILCFFRHGSLRRNEAPATVFNWWVSKRSSCIWPLRIGPVCWKYNTAFVSKWQHRSTFRSAFCEVTFSFCLVGYSLMQCAVALEFTFLFMCSGAECHPFAFQIPDGYCRRGLHQVKTGCMWNNPERPCRDVSWCSASITWLISPQLSAAVHEKRPSWCEGLFQSGVRCLISPPLVCCPRTAQKRSFLSL